MKARHFLVIPAVAATVLTFFSSSAYALTMEYITYNSFDAVVMAFQKVALIFSDGGYKGLFAAVVVLGIVLGATSVTIKAAAGVRTSPLSWGIPVMIGVVLYLGLVIPKGSVVIYDEVLNKNTTISGVPDGVVLVAGVTNKLERGLVDIISTGSDDMSYQRQAGGIGYDMLLNIEYQGALFSDQYLHVNLNNYTKDCVFFALQNSNSHLTINNLANNTNFLAEYAKGMNQAIYTTLYSESDTAGTTYTCFEAWGMIRPQLESASNYDRMTHARCADAGFDPTNPVELNQCSTVLGDIVSYIHNAAYSRIQYFQQKVLAESLLQTLATVSPDTATALLNSRNLGNSAVSSGIMFGKWIPGIRGVITAIAIGMIPFFVLFLPTPYWKQSVGIVTGFFVWLTAWGVTDAVIHQFAIEYGKKVATEVAQYQLGYMSFINFSTAGQKTLAMFTMIRSSGLMLATVITGMLIKFGGHALSSLSGKLTGAASHPKYSSDPLSARGHMESDLVEGASKNVSSEGVVGNGSMFGQSNMGYGFQARTEAAMARQVSQARGFSMLKNDFGGFDGGAGAMAGTQHGFGMRGASAQVARQSLGAGGMVEMGAMASADHRALVTAAQKHGYSPRELKELMTSGNFSKQGRVIDTFQELSGASSREEAVQIMATAGGEFAAAQGMVTRNTIDSVGAGGVAQAGTVGELSLAADRQQTLAELMWLDYAKHDKDFAGILQGQKAAHATRSRVLDEERAARINKALEERGLEGTLKAGDIATLSTDENGRPVVAVARAGAERTEKDKLNVDTGIDKKHTEKNQELMTVDGKRALEIAKNLEKQNPKGFADTIKGIRDIARKGQAVTLSIDKTQDGQYSRVVASAGGNSRLSDERTVETGWARIRKGIEKGEFGTDIQTVNQKKFRGVKEIPHPFKEGETLQVNADETYDPKTGKVVSAMYTNANGGNDVVAMRTITGPDGKEREEWVVGSYKVNSEGKTVLDDYRSVSKQTRNENGFMVDSFVDTKSGKELFKAAQKGQEGKDVHKFTDDRESQAKRSAGGIAIVRGTDVTSLSDAQQNLLAAVGYTKLFTGYAKDVGTIAGLKGKIGSGLSKAGGGSGGRGGGRRNQSGEKQLADVVAKRAEAAKKGQPPDHSKASPAQEAAYRERDKKAIKELEAKQEAADLKRKYKNPNNPDHKPPSGGETGSNTTPSTSPAPSGSVSSTQGFVEAGSATANPSTPPKPAPGAASSLLAAAPAFSLFKGVPQQHTEAGGAEAGG